MSSIRTRLLVGLGVVTATAFVTSAATTFMLFRRSLLQEFDALLGAKARTLAMLAEPEPGGVSFEFQEHGGLADFTRAFEREYYEAWQDDGKVLADSGHAVKLPKLTPGSLEAPRFRFVTLPDGRRGRMIAARFRPFAEESPQGAGNEWVTLIVARDTDQMDRALRRLGWMLVGVSTCAVVALLGFLAWIVPDSLRPLESFSKQIAGISESDLATRIATERAPAEIAPVMAGFNSLLERLDRAFQRERTFSSNVAHELRTPLAGLLATAQVTLSRARSNSEYRDALARCEEISRDTHRIMETLLTLSRLEAGKVSTDGHDVAVGPLIVSEWDKVNARAIEKHISFTMADALSANQTPVSQLLSVVVANLLDNAIEYTLPGGAIDVGVQAVGAVMALRIENGPCDIREEHATHVFQQFWRADTARSATGSHAGLGLTISQRIVEALGGKISASVNGAHFLVNVACPIADRNRARMVVGAEFTKHQ